MGMHQNTSGNGRASISWSRIYALTKSISMGNLILIAPIIERGVQMQTKIKDLTVIELEKLISDAVRRSMEEFVEDMEALSSKKYFRSVKEARDDYKEGRTKQFEEVFDV